MNTQYVKNTAIFSAVLAISLVVGESVLYQFTPFPIPGDENKVFGEQLGY